ncbi:MAG: hypothetical protein ACR2M5_11175, partial [Nakamurella sp.]
AGLAARSHVHPGGQLVLALTTGGSGPHPRGLWTIRAALGRTRGTAPLTGGTAPLTGGTARLTGGSGPHPRGLWSHPRGLCSIRADCNQRRVAETRANPRCSGGALLNLQEPSRA